MRKFDYLGRSLVALCLLVGGANRAGADVIRVGGTGAVNAMLMHVSTALAVATGTTLEVIPGLGTSGGNSALADGVLDMSVAGRSLNPAETSKGLIAIAAIRTPYVLATSHPNPNGLKSSEIASLYRSEDATWSDGTPIRIILRPTNESDNLVLGNSFPAMSAAIKQARARPDLPIAATDQDNAGAAETTPGSLIGATLTQIKMEMRNLRAVAIDGVDATFANFRNGSYPYGKTLYFVLRTQNAPAAERFMTFLRSPQGTAALLETDVMLSSD
jgi:phosphate transport system substrate-binding protein